MKITTIADVDTEVYFVNNGKVHCDKVASINIEVTTKGGTEIKYRFSSPSIQDRKEAEIALTQEDLFEKIKIKQ